MTVAVASASRPDGTGTSQTRVRPRRVVLSRSTRQSVRSGAAWGIVFGAYTALQAIAYTSTYKTAAAREALAKSLGSSGGLNALAGPARDLQTVGGYTVWKSLGFLSVVGSIWALLIATKLLRGEEESGRAELLLAGPVTRRTATVEELVGLGAGATALFASTAVFVVLIGLEGSVRWQVSASLFYALSVAAGAALFMAAGALASQLVGSRRRAAAYTGAALGIAFTIRMLSDATAGGAWLHWVTPLGWIEELGAFTSPTSLPLIPLAGATVLLVVATVLLAGRRDFAAGVLQERTTKHAQTAFLRGTFGLELRLSGPMIAAWLGGISAFGLLLGGVANAAAKSLEASPSVRAALDRLGGHSGLVKEYLGVSFLSVTLLVMLVAASQITSSRREEASGRVEQLLVQPVARTHWLLCRLGVGAGAILCAGALAGCFVWLGSTSQHAHVGLLDLLVAGINTVPAALCLFGFGVLAWAHVPRLATGVVYAVLVWSFLIELLAGVGRPNRWLLDTSLFHHIAPSPAVPVHWLSAASLIGIGGAAAALGVLRLSRRDLAPS